MNPSQWQETVAELKAHGYGVRVQHLRHWRVKKNGGVPLESVAMFKKLNETAGIALLPRDIFELDSKGGATHCQIFSIEDGSTLVEVEIKVHPRDHYCKRIGREKALGVALKRLKEMSPTIRDRIVEGRQKDAARA